MYFRSIGIFVHSKVPWELPLVRSAVVSVDNFTQTPEFVHFFHVLSGHALDPSDGGHIDLFVPLGSCGVYEFITLDSRFYFSAKFNFV